MSRIIPGPFIARQALDDLERHPEALNAERHPIGYKTIQETSASTCWTPRASEICGSRSAGGDFIPVFSYDFRTRTVGLGAEIKGVTF
ncbi:MAG: hypothetical protein M3Y13_05460 [Armatimonadota bacterium]|nr:hypothetical protein [Armatimonadota bacterium]